MIRTLSYENIRHGSRTFCFDRINHLCGYNGVGKTTVADAIAYVFTGCDSQGTPAPVHLISEGSEKLVVKIDTGKALIERTLTAKKNSTIKLTRQGAPAVTLSQQELTDMAGSKDAFLAAFMVGYFMNQTEEKKTKILSEAFPPVDKRQLLEKILGGGIPNYLLPCIDFSKRTDIIIAKISSTRLDLVKEENHLKGRLETYKAMPPPDAEPAPIEDRTPEFNQRMNAWEKYRQDVTAWRLWEIDAEKAKVQNESLEQQRARLIEQRDSIVVPSSLPLYTSDKEIEALRSKIKRCVASAPIRFIPGAECCPTCGQVIGMKHRESVAATNAKLQQEWEESKVKIDADNAEIERQIHELTQKDLLAREQFKRVEKQREEAIRARESIQKTLDRLPRPVGVAPRPDEPQRPPFEDVSTEEFNQHRSEVLKCEARRMVIAKQRKDYALAQEQCEALEKDLRIKATFARECEALEDALKSLDAHVFAENEKLYTLSGGYRIVVTDGVITIMDDSGKQYSQMSTGERIRADAYLSEKLASTLPHKVKFLFVDNADLVSGPLSLKIEQLFLTSVEEKPFHVKTKSHSGMEFFSTDIETTRAKLKQNDLFQGS